jgi:dihydropyrimidinase
MTMLRGKVVAEDGKIVGEKGAGQFLKRGLSPYARPKAG